MLHATACACACCWKTMLNWGHAIFSQATSTCETGLNAAVQCSSAVHSTATIVYAHDESRFCRLVVDEAESLSDNVLTLGCYLVVNIEVKCSNFHMWRKWFEPCILCTSWIDAARANWRVASMPWRIMVLKPWTRLPFVDGSCKVLTCELQTGRMYGESTYSENMCLRLPPALGTCLAAYMGLPIFVPRQIWEVLFYMSISSAFRCPETNLVDLCFSPLVCESVFVAQNGNIISCTWMFP